MKQNLSRHLSRLQQGFGAFTAGQKLVSVVGVLGLVLGGFMVVRWVATPSYAPLFSNMSAADASAVIDELEATGVPYELTNNGATVNVPREQVYETRISLSGQGLPEGGEDGYSLLDEQSLSTSQFQEQTSFKRAMEGELSTTVEAIDGVRTAVVHLALPAKQVFAKTQEPPTASVLVETEAGATMQAEQVQAVVHLVASSVEGLAPEKVTVADSSGRVLSADSTTGAGASTRTQAVKEYEEEMTGKIQQTLDRVLGAGNSIVAVTANLDFDRTVRETTTYESDPGQKPLSRSNQSETFQGAGAGAPGGQGVVGPDGQMDPQGTGAGADSRYTKKSVTEDNAVDTVKERRETAPGTVGSLHVGVALDLNAPVKVGANDMRALIAAAIGEDAQRGDTVEVSQMPFDRTAEDLAAEELELARKADERTALLGLARNVGLGALVVLMVLLAWLSGRKRAKAREQAATYVVEQLRADAAVRTPAPVEPSPALAALESSEVDEREAMREELSALVERQPEEVAALLRGWLVEPPR